MREEPCLTCAEENDEVWMYFRCPNCKASDALVWQDPIEGLGYKCMACEALFDYPEVRPDAPDWT